MRRPSRSDRVYRWLLRLFPFDFRREFESEMKDVFRQERRHVEKTGSRLAAGLWLKTLRGFLRSAPVEHFDVLRRDIRFGLRSLGRKPGFTVVAIVALAIGIGASLAVFSLANGLLLKPLPVTNPETVVRVLANNFSNMPYRSYLEYRDRNHSLSELAAFQGMTASIRLTDSSEPALACAVTGNFFSALGVRAALGRPIGPIDDEPGAPGAVMLSDTFWQRRFAADSAVVGKTIFINGSPFTIVGVAPASFTGTLEPGRPDLWIPWNSPAPGRPSTALLIGRLRSGMSPEQAQADLSTIAAQLSAEQSRPVRVSLYRARLLHPEAYIPVAAFSGFLMVIVVLVLAITCLNIATMLLARAVARRQEMGIRIALGAGRGQLVRQLMTEGLLLSFAGASTAVVITLAAAQTIHISIPGLPTDSIALDLGFDWRVGVFTVGMTLATTLLFALAPALQATKTDVIPALKDGTLTTAPTRSRLRALFIVAQVAMSTLLLVIGALLVRTLTSSETANRGFNADGILTAGINLASAGYTRERGLEFQGQLLQTLETVPGVLSANLVAIVPLTLSNMESRYDWNGSRIAVFSNIVSRSHFRTLGIPLLEGRDFSPDDRYGELQVAILNERLARRLWPGESSIGKRFQDYTIVGVVRDSKYVGVVEEPKFFLYTPLSQTWVPETSLLVKSREAALDLLPAVRAAVLRLDPTLPLFNAATLQDATSISLLPLQIAAALAAALGAVAVILGTIGIYGVVSYFVRQRTREIGIRIALGAQPSRVVGLMTRQVVRWTAIGLGLGLAAAAGAAQLLNNLIYGITPTDPVVFAGITMLLAGTSCAACWVPARRAARIDPISALREE